MDSLNSKVELLEKTLTKFKAEVDVKMKIVEQLFSNRTEQMSVQKKLLEQEELLYQCLMSGWKSSIDGENIRTFANTIGAGEQDHESNMNFCARSRRASLEQGQTENFNLTRVNEFENKIEIDIDESCSPQVVDFTADKETTSVDTFPTTISTVIAPDPGSFFLDGVVNVANTSEHGYFPSTIEIQQSYSAKIESGEVEVLESELRSSSVICDTFGISTDSTISDHFQESISSNDQGNFQPFDKRQSINYNSNSSPCPFKCEICGKILGSQNNLKYHLTIHSGKMKFQCGIPQCGKKFPRKGSLERHKLNHEAYKTLRCHDCPDVVFSGKEILVEHMESHHGIKKPWMCSFCRTCFSQRKTLQQHIISAHPGLNTAVSPFQKRIPCSMCSKSYSTRNDLLVHIRSHTGERPFICSGCQKSFADRRNMKKHIETCSKVSK